MAKPVQNVPISKEVDGNLIEATCAPSSVKLYERRGWTVGEAPAGQTPTENPQITVIDPGNQGSDDDDLGEGDDAPKDDDDAEISEPTGHGSENESN